MKTSAAAKDTSSTALTSAKDENKGFRFMCLSSVRLMVLLVLCLQNSLFTVIRRFSLGVRAEKYSKYEVLVVGEIIKLIFSAYMIQQGGGSATDATERTANEGAPVIERLRYLMETSKKMAGLALVSR